MCRHTSHHCLQSQWQCCWGDRKSTRLNSSHRCISYAVFCSKKKSCCGRHFHSLAAFDAHHTRGEDGWPVCLDPIDLEDRDGKPRLEALTTDGECRAYEPGIR